MLTRVKIYGAIKLRTLRFICRCACYDPSHCDQMMLLLFGMCNQISVEPAKDIK